MLLFALDLGNRQAKMMNDSVIKVYPSYYLDSAELGNRSLLGNFNLNTVTKDYVSSKDHSSTYVWGSDLDVENVQVIDTISTKNRYSSKYYKVLVDMAIGEMVVDYPNTKNKIVDCVLVSGVPSNDFMSEETLDELSKVLKGDHSITINGDKYYIRVQEVHFLPQPIGTLFNEIIDDNGDMLDSSLNNSNVGIVDLGGLTILIDLVSKMRLETDKRVQLESGAFTLYDAITKDLITAGYRINVYEVEKVIRKYNVNGEYLWSPDGVHTVNITDFVMNNRIRFTKRVANSVKTIYKGFDRIQTILVTGGASNLLIKDEFISEVPNAQFIDNSDVANVKGFYKFGLTQGVTEVAHGN